MRSVIKDYYRSSVRDFISRQIPHYYVISRSICIWDVYVVTNVIKIRFVQVVAS